MPEPRLGLPWLTATVTDLRAETDTAKSIAFSVPGWPGHLAGQHIDLRLTAEDGYVAQRSFSLASPAGNSTRSEEHTSELQSLMRISYAVFCLKKKKIITKTHKHHTQQ